VIEQAGLSCPVAMLDQSNEELLAVSLSHLRPPGPTLSRDREAHHSLDDRSCSAPTHTGDGVVDLLAKGSQLDPAAITRLRDRYGFRLAEVEASLACAAVGLDEGLGLLHADYPGRPSLSLDLLEVLRPEVESYILRVTRERAFRKSDFHEARDGHVRVLSPLSHELAEVMMPMCARQIAPYAEAVMHSLLELVSGKPKSARLLHHDAAGKVKLRTWSILTGRSRLRRRHFHLRVVERAEQRSNGPTTSTATSVGLR
jgi:hypothetical protein